MNRISNFEARWTVVIQGEDKQREQVFDGEISVSDLVPYEKDKQREIIIKRIAHHIETSSRHYKKI